MTSGRYVIVHITMRLLAAASLLATTVVLPATAAAQAKAESAPVKRIVIARDADSLLFFLPVHIGGVRLVMIVDSGCTESILTPDDAKLLAGRLKTSGEVVGAGITGTARMDVVTTPGLTVGGRDLGPRRMVLGKEGVGVSLLGMRDLMEIGTVTIGRDTMVIDLAPPPSRAKAAR